MAITRFPITPVQKTFLETLLQRGVLKFGEFKTKSGRLSPFFMDFGSVCSGNALEQLIPGYVEKVKEFSQCNNLFGPAYKGIPLAVALSAPFSKALHHEVTFTFNRKEAKDHGEGGDLVGLKYTGQEKVIIVEDVLTGGTSLRDSLVLLKARGIKPIAAIIGVDRQEKGSSQKGARQEIEEDHGIPVRSVLNLDQILETLSGQMVLGKYWIDAALLEKIQNYRSQYGG